MTRTKRVLQQYLAPRRFGIVGYVCIIFHIFCGLVFAAVIIALRARENEKFSCSIYDKASSTFKTFVNKACFLKYDQTYNFPLPLYNFILLSFGIPVLISTIYLVVVRKRFHGIEPLNYQRQSDGEANEWTHILVQNRRIFFSAMYFYFIHLVLRALVGIIFTVLQHTYFYPKGFDVNYNCSLPSTNKLKIFKINTPKNGSRILDSTSVSCTNATASDKWILGMCASAVNGLIAIIILLEVIYLFYRRLAFCKSLSFEQS